MDHSAQLDPLIRQFDREALIAFFRSACGSFRPCPEDLSPLLKDQEGFRIVITDAYERHCAVSGERVLPVLDAAHIRPYSKEGTHKPDNGVLLRSDLHTLFDRGYATVTSDHHFEVSRRIKEDFDNGREYYKLHGREIFVPKKVVLRPAGENLEWHNENVFKG